MRVSIRILPKKDVAVGGGGNAAIFYEGWRRWLTRRRRWGRRGGRSGSGGVGTAAAALGTGSRGGSSTTALPEAATATSRLWVSVSYLKEVEGNEDRVTE